MLNLPKELSEALQDPETIKMLTTTDEKGNPHTVFKGSLIMLDDGYLAYMELLEFSNTTKNLLRNLYIGRQISIGIWNKEKLISYQIKGVPYRFIYEGSIWDKFLEETWEILPDSNPTGVWLLEPCEVINQNFESRRKKLEEDYPGHKVFFSYMGVRE